MIPILLELIARLCFSGIAIVNKFSRKDGLSAVGVMGQYAWALPVFAALGAFLYAFDNSVFNLELAYWRTLGLWLVLCALLNYLIFFLSKYQALTEMGGYKLGFSMVVSVLLDYFWYDKAEWSLVYIIGGLIAVTGGVLLSKRPMTDSEISKRIPMPFPVWVVLALSFGVAACAPLGYALYKDALLLANEQPLVHTVISQMVLFLTFWIIGGRDYAQSRSEGSLKAWRVLLVVICVSLAAIVQTYSIAALSVTSLMVLGLLSGAIVTASDIISGEVAPTRRNILSIGLVFGGSLLIAVSRF